MPRWDDSVNKLPGVGKETFSKLKDLKIAGLSTPLANYRITTGAPASEPALWEQGLVSCQMWSPVGWRQGREATNTLSQFYAWGPDPWHPTPWGILCLPLCNLHETPTTMAMDDPSCIQCDSALNPLRS